MTCAAGLLIADPSLRTAVKFALEAQGLGVDVIQDMSRLADGTALKGDESTGGDATGVIDESSCLIVDVAPDDLASIARLDELRRDQRHGPVIVLTSCPSLRMHEAIAAAGATLVEKPLLTDVLCTTIERLTEMSRAA